MANIMYTKLTVWTYVEKENKWYGLCRECKGEKAKYTPQALKNAGLQPCSMCTNLEMYNSASKEEKA